MSAPPAIPQRPPRRIWRRIWPPAAACALAALALAGTRLFCGSGLQLPPCRLRAWTGQPCLGCGGTRCALSLAEGDVAAALFFNPIAALAFLALPAWLLVAIAEAATGREFVVPALQRFWAWRGKIPAIVAALVLQWIYLAWCLPK